MGSFRIIGGLYLDLVLCPGLGAEETPAWATCRHQQLGLRATTYCTPAFISVTRTCESILRMIGAL